MLVEARRHARLREYRAKLAAFVEEACSALSVAPVFLGGDIQPQLRLIGFFEHDAESRCEFGVRPGAAGASVVACDAEGGPRQLSREFGGGNRSREGFDEIESGDGESLRSGLQVLSGL